MIACTFAPQGITTLKSAECEGSGRIMIITSMASACTEIKHDAVL
jgi:hypothetical protein